jgi:hypothetical protein
VGWFERAFGRAGQASAGQRVTRADRERAIDTFAELNALKAERERLMRDGLAGNATIVGIRQNATTTTLGSWHEVELDVRVPNRAAYRATRRIALELSSAPHFRVGAEVPVRVDPADPSKVLIVANL